MDRIINFLQQNWLYITLAILILFLIFGLYLVYNMKQIVGPDKTIKYKFKDPSESITIKACQNLSGAIKISTTLFDKNTLVFQQYLQERYPNIHNKMSKEVINGESLLYKLSGNGEKDALILCAHLDVVPASGEWKYPAFSGELQEGRVWGRGTLDCKNVLIAVMEAMETLISQGIESNRDIYLSFGHDEEIGGENGAKEIAKILKSRGVKAEILLDEGGHIAKQFMDKSYSTLATINVCEKGYIDIKLIAKDIGGHSSKPPKHTGLGRIAEAICRIEASPMKPMFTDVTKDYFLKIAPLMDTKYKLYISNLYIFKKKFFKLISKSNTLKATINTTFAATMAEGSVSSNILPLSANATINVRILPGHTCDDVIKHIENIVKPLGITIEILSQTEPQANSSYKTRMFMELEESIKTRFGEGVIITPGLMLGATDSGYYKDIAENIFRFMPFVIKPSDASKMHTINESIPIHSFGAGVEFYIEFIQKITKILEKSK